MTAANLQPVGDVDRTDLLDAFEQRFGAGVRPLLQCKKQSGGLSYLSEVRSLHHLLAPLSWRHHPWACCVTYTLYPIPSTLYPIPGANICSSLGCTSSASPRMPAWWQVWMCVDRSFNVVPCDTVCINHPCRPIHPCGNTITFADNNFRLVKDPEECQLGPCVAHTGTCHKP